MGIISNGNVEEKELYSAYGMTVYGKENDYEWSIYPDRPREKCYISLRINDGKRDIINSPLGNRCIFKENFDRTIDNFLYWIHKDLPSDDTIENAVFKVLTRTDSLFNHRIEQRKHKEFQEEENQKRIAERERQERVTVVEIIDYCAEYGFFSYEKYGEIIILNPLHNKAKEMIKSAINQCNTKRMGMYIDFAMKHSENNDLRIVASGTIEEVFGFVREQKSAHLKV